MSSDAPQSAYKFYQVDSCNMCGSPAERHEIIGQRLNTSQGRRPRSKTGLSVTIVRCKVCDLIFANPQPIPSEAVSHDFLAAWTPDYFAYEEDYFSAEISRAKNLLGHERQIKALDIGAGIGKGMRSLEKAGFDAYGIEPSANACEIAYDKMGAARERLFCKSIEEADFSDETFDFVNFGAVLEHLYDPAGSLRKALKWLKVGGIIFAEVPNSNYFVSRLINFYNKLNLTNYTTHTSPMHAPFHHFEFGVKSFEKFCEKNACELVDKKIYVCHTEFVPKPFVPVVNKYMALTDTGMQISVFIRKNK